VDRLFWITDAKEAAHLFRIADGFVDKWGNDLPLEAAGVLKLIEQPVFPACIEAVGEIGAFRAELIAEYNGEVSKSEFTGLTNDCIVAAIVAFCEASGGECALRLPCQFAVYPYFDPVGGGIAKFIVEDDIGKLTVTFFNAKLPWI